VVELWLLAPSHQATRRVRKNRFKNSRITKTATTIPAFGELALIMSILADLTR
jgi:hypothetical protein